MKFFYRDENTLVLRPDDLWGHILVGFFLGTILLLTIRIFGTRSHLICERIQSNQIHCQLRSTLFGFELENEAFDDLHEAQMEVSHGRSGDFYSVVLITTGTQRELTYGDYSSDACEQIIEDINTFVQSPNLSHLEVFPGVPVYFWLGPIFYLVILANIFRDIQARLITWTFDRSQKIVTHRHKTLFDVKTTEYPLDDITGAQIGTKPGRRNSTTCRIELLTRDGETIFLTRWYSSEKSTAYTTTVLREFLQLNSLPLFKK